MLVVYRFDIMRSKFKVPCLYSDWCRLRGQGWLGEEGAAVAVMGLCLPPSPSSLSVRRQICRLGEEGAAVAVMGLCLPPLSLLIIRSAANLSVGRGGGGCGGDGPVPPPPLPPPCPLSRRFSGWVRRGRLWR